MAKKRLDHDRFSGVVREVMARYGEARGGNGRDKLFEDITNKRDDFADWFHEVSGIKRSGK